MAARTLYVNRPLLNANDLIAWAKGQGFATVMLPADLHVTVAYSNEPFDWSGIRPDEKGLMALSGGRAVKAFGKATVLTFASDELQARWRFLRDAGASFDFPTYQPHVTFTYEPGDVDLDQIEPFPGPLMFGPEIFVEIDPDWASNVEEKSSRPRLGSRIMTDIYVAPFEAKAAGNADSGEFEGYGAVFGNVDWHGDVIVPGAFTPGLAEVKTSGRRIAMHLNHGLPALGGRRGVGSWQVVEEDSKGLHVKGRVAGMDTETGRYIYSGIRDGALSGLSVGYRVRPNGAEFGTKAAAIATGARRVLKDIALEEISVVDTPSNAQSLVLQVKAQLSVVDSDRARSGIAALMALHTRAMTGQASPTAADRAEFLSHLQDLQDAVGGPLLEGGTKSAPTNRRECEDALRDAGFTRSQAARFAATVFPTLLAHRDDEGGQASPSESKAAFNEFMSLFG
jgi:hypothetical protein